MNDLTVARWSVAALACVTAALSLYLFSPYAVRTIRKLPRAKLLGIVLSTLCWTWVAAELTLHPIDMIPFSERTILIICTLCVPLSWTLLQNLLCARAIGGLMMLWPMPVFLVVREQVTLWRLVPVVVGYLSLIAGMITVFYPWTFRVACDKLATRPHLRHGVAVTFAVIALLSLICLFALGKVVGE